MPQVNDAQAKLIAAAEMTVGQIALSTKDKLPDQSLTTNTKSLAGLGMLISGLLSVIRQATSRTCTLQPSIGQDGAVEKWTATLSTVRMMSGHPMADLFAPSEIRAIAEAVAAECALTDLRANPAEEGAPFPEFDESTSCALLNSSSAVLALAGA